MAEWCPGEWQDMTTMSPFGMSGGSAWQCDICGVWYTSTGRFAPVGWHKRGDWLSVTSPEQARYKELCKQSAIEVEIQAKEED